MRFLFEKTVRTDVLKENSWEPPRPDDGKGYRKPISRFPPECFLPRCSGRGLRPWGSCSRRPFGRMSWKKQLGTPTTGRW